MNKIYSCKNTYKNRVKALLITGQYDNDKKSQSDLRPATPVTDCEAYS